MKKSLIFAAIAAVALSACAKFETFQSTSDEDAISFGVYAKKAALTRATYYGDQTTATLANNANDYGFGVFAYYTQTADVSASNTPNFMYNQQVFYDDTADSQKYPTHWYYTPLKYWPNGQNSTAVDNTTHADKVSFYAYAPYTAVGDAAGVTAFTPANATTAGLPVVTYVLPTNPAEQVDLLYATPVLNQTKQTLASNIAFVFHHALSKVNLKVQAIADHATASSGKLDAATKIILTKVEVFGTFATTNTLSLATGDWTNPAVTTNDGTSAYITYNAADFGSTTTVNEVEGFDVTETLQDLNAAKPMIIIPVEMAANKFKIQVTYHVITTDSALGGYSDVENKIYALDTDGITFAKNKVNDVTVKIGVNSVDFTASVTDWDTPAVDGGTVYVPQNS